MGVNFSFRKKTIPGGGSEGGLAKDHTFPQFFLRPSLNLWEFILLQQLLLLFPFLGFAACFSPFLSFFPCLFPLCTISNHPMRHRACCCCCGITSQHLTLSCPGNTSQKPLLPQPSPLPSHYYFTKTLDYLIISFWINLSVTTLKIWVPLVCKGTYHN